MSLKASVYVCGKEPDWLGALTNSDVTTWWLPSSSVDSGSYITAARCHDYPYISGACPVCKTASNCGSKLSLCSNCKLVRYCSKSHQKQDWLQHKTFCRWIAPGGRSQLAAGAGIRNHMVWLHRQADLKRRFMLSNPRQDERLCTMYFFGPPVCPVCHSAEAGLECADCCSAFYCCQEHKTEDTERHTRACGHLKLILLREQHLHKYGGFVLPPILPAPAAVYSPLSGTIHSVVNDQLNALRFFEHPDSSRQIVPVAVLKQLLYEPLTLLYALQEINRLPSIEERSILTIHYIYKDTTPYTEIPIIWEYILHRLPRLRRIKFVYVLLEQLDERQQVIPPRQHVPCKKCQQGNRQIIFEQKRASKKLEAPDVIVWYTIGKHRPDPFKKLSLSTREVPVVLSFSDPGGLSKVMDVLFKVGVRPTLPPLMDVRQNPFHGGMPYPEPNRTSPHEDVAFNNEYMMVLNCRKF